jgi:hypothetical protein
MPRQTPAELLAEVRAALRTIPIEEGYIHEDGLHVEGLCDGRKIVVNPQPSIVDTVIHEVLHFIHPRWGHDRIYREMRRIFKAMSDADVRAIYRTHQRRKRSRSRTINLSEEA